MQMAEDITDGLFTDIIGWTVFQRFGIEVKIESQLFQQIREQVERRNQNTRYHDPDNRLALQAKQREAKGQEDQLARLCCKDQSQQNEAGEHNIRRLGPGRAINGRYPFIPYLNASDTWLLQNINSYAIFS